MPEAGQIYRINKISLRSEKKNNNRTFLYMTTVRKIDIAKRAKALEGLLNRYFKK